LYFAVVLRSVLTVWLYKNIYPRHRLINWATALAHATVISANGRHIVHSHGGQPGSDTGQYDVPCHLAVDDNEFVFVVEAGNHRVTL